MTAIDDEVGRVAPALCVTTLSSVRGACLFVPRPSRDERGFVSHALDARWLEEAGLDPGAFVQDHVSRTRQGVIRGMHLRLGLGEALLVRCTRGVVFSVIMDLRRGSPTFRNVFTTELRADPPVTLYVPPGCAHGLQSLTEPADVTYRMNRPRGTGDLVTIAWDDPDLAVRWPLRPPGTPSQNRAELTLADVVGPAR